LKATSLNLIRFFRVFVVTIIISIIDVVISVDIGIAVDGFYGYIHHFHLTSNYTNCMKIVKISISQFVYFLLSSSQYHSCELGPEIPYLEIACKNISFFWFLFISAGIKESSLQQFLHCCTVECQKVLWWVFLLPIYISCLVYFVFFWFQFFSLFSLRFLCGGRDIILSDL